MSPLYVRLQLIEQDGMLEIYPELKQGLAALISHVEAIASLRVRREQITHGLARVKFACDEAQKEMDKL